MNESGVPIKVIQLQGVVEGVAAPPVWLSDRGAAVVPWHGVFQIARQADQGGFGGEAADKLDADGHACR